MFLCLDLGNVIFDIIPISEFPEIQFPHLEVRRILDNTNGLMDVGLIDLKGALSIYGLNEPSIIDAWNKSVVPNEKMVNWIASLKQVDVKIAILSNIGIDHVNYIKEICPTLFDDCALHLSCEVGAQKPSKIYYQSFLMQHPEFKGSFYLDDREENCHSGKEFGLNSIQFDLKKFNFKNSIEQNNYLSQLSQKIFKFSW